MLSIGGIEMKAVHKYMDELSGREFDTPIKALMSEKRSKDIRDTFAFYDPVKDVGCEFANGGWCVQRTEEFYNKLVDALIEMVLKYEPWVAEQMFINASGISRATVSGQSILGRYLDDGKSDLYHWYHVQSNICPVCFKEYGQTYYALHCTHDGVIPECVAGLI